jgi:hypothetical protein
MALMSKFASLTAGLLARKGEAEPAATPFADELLTRVGSPAADIRPLTPMTQHHHPVQAPATVQALVKPPAPKPLLPDASPFGTFGRRTPTELERARHDLTMVQAHNDEEPDHCATCIAPEDATKTFHVNLRLKRPRFVKLKLSAALLRRPVQDVVSEALDQWFDKLPPDVLGDCACLRSRGGD